MVIRLFFPGRIRTYDTGLRPSSRLEGEELVVDVAGDGVLSLVARSGFSDHLDSPDALRRGMPGSYTLKDALENARAVSGSLRGGATHSSQASRSSARSYDVIIEVKGRADGPMTIARVCGLAHEQIGLLRLDLDGETLWEAGCGEFAY